MHVLDYVVLVVYFFILIGIGIYCARRIHKQEDYLLGGRGFGKLLQTFAAFGAGTGSSDPINTARSTFVGGMSGMWSVMFWLFVTPFYWITGVWYRRMRHLTLGDWYVERYESKRLGAAYSIFGVLFFMIYGSMFFTAIATTAEPMIGETVNVLGSQVPLKYVLIPTVAVVVLLYGMAGGLAAAYYTDLLQGICIIALSVMLIPLGLTALQNASNLNPTGAMAGTEVMHDQLPKSFFDIITSSAAEFSVYYLLAIVFANLAGIVVQPHFIATGGGSAKSEQDARVGLVVGNFLKRFCTLGWVLTALIAAALYADIPELVDHPDRTWGYASMHLLGPGFRGLMLACLLAALMSSVDAQMVVGAGLILRNLYMPFIKPKGTEKEFLWIGRIVGVVVVGGSVVFALTIFDMLGQLKLTFWFPLVFAAPFWVGMYWRRASTRAAWITVIYCLLFFFIIPFFGPKVIPALRTNESLMQLTLHTRTTQQVPMSKSDLRREYSREVKLWNDSMEKVQGDEKERLQQLEPSLSPDGNTLSLPFRDGVKEMVADKTRQPKVKNLGGKSIFWDSVDPIDPSVKPEVVKTEELDDYTIRETLAYPRGTVLQVKGNLKLNLVLYKPFLDMQTMSASSLNALELVPKIVMPFLVMIGLSFFTPRNSEEALDRYYAKMKTPVVPDPDADAKNLIERLADKEFLKSRKLFPDSDLEIQRPTFADIFGFVACFLTCFAIIGIAMWIATIGT